jgi:hypothetical protein
MHHHGRGPRKSLSVTTSDTDVGVSKSRRLAGIKSIGQLIIIISQHALGLAGLRELIRRRPPAAAAGRPTILFQF